ncbi:MAG: hypothetical protein Q7T45_04265 [Bradyrhizobium sp.]|uniref:phage tail protein n=1 Tax=Bradyrhizobium sp. TaxID=376 RepID=UPI00271FA26B|nr:hypothetical protein [Bradyrhizobium sp.]MDO8397012.1 hypothetical protein [Bradyrhizobium sp.]
MDADFPALALAVRDLYRRLLRRPARHHSHPMVASTNAADTPNVQNALPGTGAVSQLYWGDPPDTLMAAQAISPTGGSQPHSNFQPYLCVNFIISLFGIFPPS